MMKEDVKIRTKAYWGKKASRNLLRTFNCPASTIQTVQDMISAQDDTLLKASAALAGGVGACGSTCGVVIGGAMSLALMHDTTLADNGPAGQIGLLSIVGDYVDWFRNQYGTTSCREKAGVDFWTLSGFLRYLIPPDRFLGCLAHINGAVQYLHDRKGHDLPKPKGDAGEDIFTPSYCARTVLEEVRKRTNVGNPHLERVAVVFDGGVGLRGGACGALVGAVMAISALMWINLRDASWLQAYRDMLLGLHTLRAGELDKPDDPYAVIGRIVTRFKSEVGSIDCSSITGKVFADYASFQAHMEASDGCSRMIELAIDEATSAVEQYRRAH
jgi:C_GCAxxG_C_C family probable redox protein